MHELLRIKIKNWKLAFLALLFIVVFISLGTWQLSRADQKKAVLKSYQDRTQQPPLILQFLNANNDLRFYRTQLEGNFDNDHHLLLDNKIFHGQVGYEVYTPFKPKGMETTILVDRGFVSVGNNRNILPTISNIPSNTVIEGMLNFPPHYFSFGKITDSLEINWPLRIEYMDLGEISNMLNTTLFPYILTLAPHHPAAYPLEWQINTMTPEKHLGYAVQWFALALTLLILFIVLNRV